MLSAMDPLDSLSSSPATDFFGTVLTHRPAHSKTYTDFPIFSKFPLELQLVIWDFAVAAYDSRILALVMRERPRSAAEEFWIYGLSKVKALPNPIPAILQATHYSRKMALKRWVLTFGNRLAGRPRYFDFSRDIILFQNREAAYWFRSCIRSKIRIEANPQVKERLKAERDFLDENMQYAAVGLREDRIREELQHLQHFAGFPRRFKTHEAIFYFTSTERSKLVLTRESEQFFNFNDQGIVWSEEWRRRFEYCVRYESRPYVILIPGEFDPQETILDWIDLYGGRGKKRRRPKESEASRCRHLAVS